MSRQTVSQTQASQQKPAMTQSGLLQRKCACGNHTPAGGECAECAKKETGLQRKLAIGASNDPLEREADRVADQVLAIPTNAAGSDAPPRIQRFTGQSNGQQDTAPASVERVLSRPGSPLEPALRFDMEQRFGRDFSRVRVHSGAAAEQSARDVNAAAYTLGHNVVFGAGQMAPETPEGRRLIAHELTHVVQQTDVDGLRVGRSNVQVGFSPISPLSRIGIQRQTGADNQARATPDMMRIYSFGPTGAGRMVMRSGTTIFPPAAPVDAKGNELVRAGTTAQPIRSRFGRYFTLDERHRPYPPPVPTCAVKAVVEWTPDDGSAPSKDQQVDDAAQHYAAGEPLSTKLGSEYIFPNDRPGVLTLGYIFNNPDLPFLLMGHSVHFVDDPAVPPGATVLANDVKGPLSAAAAPAEPRAATDAPAKAGGGAPEKKPEAKGTPRPPSPSAQNAPPTAAGQIKELTELIKKTSDAAVKDPLVRKLRDLLSRLQPFMPAKDAQKEIDDAIKSLIKDGADAGIMAILKAVTGKSPSTMPENRTQTGPNVPPKDLGEHILQGPKIPIKDAPALPSSTSFHYRNGPQKSYQAGAPITFTLVPPDNFNSLQGAKRLVIVAEADRNAPNPERFARVDLESGSPKPIELQAPQKPGKYVIRVDIGLGFDFSNMQEFEVNAPQKK